MAFEWPLCGNHDFESGVAIRSGFDSLLYTPVLEMFGCRRPRLPVHRLVVATAPAPVARHSTCAEAAFPTLVAALLSGH
ncbi:MAG: hypothetical protein U0792_09820 [Gemmataceae bacterium]